MFKYIREGRMGPPKTYKTGAVVNTYPTPMLVLEGDEGGLDTALPARAPLWITKDEISSYVAKKTSELPPVTAWNFKGTVAKELTNDYSITRDFTAFPNFNTVGNILLKAPSFPWKTVVIDPITELSNIIHGHIAAANPGALADARKWAAGIGLKVAQTMSEFCRLPCHVVFIMHVSTDKNDTTGEIVTEPMIYSRFRELVGGQLSQFLYSVVEPGTPPKAFVLTQPSLYVKGIGVRWPANLSPKVGANFLDIYGESVKSGEIERPL